MNKSSVLRRILLAPSPLRSSLLPLSFQSPQPTRTRQFATQNVAQTSFWVSLIPKPFRKRPKIFSKTKVASKEWNPATFYIVIYLLIGSMAIQMIALRNEYGAFSRRADAKIGLLKEIIERIQKGEDVDVEGLLGTGDAAQEKEWEEVIREIETEEAAREQSINSRPKQSQTQDQTLAVPKPTIPALESEETHQNEKPNKTAPPGFY